MHVHQRPHHTFKCGLQIKLKQRPYNVVSHQYCRGFSLLSSLPSYRDVTSIILSYSREMLQQAQILGEDHILLKFDLVKAFDKIEWPFLVVVLEKMGMARLLTDFLKAGFASARSSILLNGKPTKSFPLKSLLRQGCPLSPLLFIIAFDTLNLQLQQALTNNVIRGIYFPKTGIKTLQNTFAVDHSAVIIWAIMRDILALHLDLQKFGTASGLHCAWDKTRASYIPDSPPPLEFRLLPWT